MSHKWSAGTRVRWAKIRLGDADDCDGEVIEVGDTGIKIQWSDGTVGVLNFNDLEPNVTQVTSDERGGTRR